MVPDVLDQLFPRHSHAGVGDREATLGLVTLDLDLERNVFADLFRQLHEAHLVERVDGVGDELAKKDFLLCVQRMDQDVQQLLNLGLEGQFLAGGAGG
jgi:hypothetical protein